MRLSHPGTDMLTQSRRLMHPGRQLVTYSPARMGPLVSSIQAGMGAHLDMGRQMPRSSFLMMRTMMLALEISQGIPDRQPDPQNAACFHLQAPTCTCAACIRMHPHALRGTRSMQRASMSFKYSRAWSRMTVMKWPMRTVHPG